MTTLSGTNYASFVKDALADIQELMGSVENVKGTSGSDIASNIDIGNLLNGTASNITQLVQGTDSQKASAIQNIISDIMGLFSNLNIGEDKKARAEVENSDKQISENDNKAKTTYNQVSTRVQELLDQANLNATSIAEALAKIQELGGDEGEIAKAKAQLEEQLSIIEESKEALSNESTSPDDRKKALVNILNASKMISELVGNVESYKNQIVEQNGIVEENSEAISALSNETSTTLQDGIAQMQEALVNAGVLTKDQAVLTVKGGKETAVGTAQEITGQAMTSGPQAMFTGSKGAQFILAGNDKISAGATFMQGAVQGMSKLTGSIGEMGQFFNSFVQFSNGLGTFLEGATNLVGQYDTTVNPMIESLGTWTKIADTNKDLESYTQEYTQEVLGESLNTDNNSDASQKIEAEDVENVDSKNIKFKKFEFDTSAFKAE